MMPNNDIELLRTLFNKASKNEKHCQELIEASKGSDLKNETIAHAYWGAAELISASFKTWPNQKLKLFRLGRNKIENAVSVDDQSVEIRFIRYCIQQNCPFIVGYSDNLKEDKMFILEHIETSDFPKEQREIMLQFIEENK